MFDLFKEEKNNKIITFSWLFVILIFALFLFTAILFLPVQTDIQIHDSIILSLYKGQSAFPAHFLFFVLVMVASFFSQNMTMIFIGSIMVLSFSVMLKFWVTKQILYKELVIPLPDKKIKNVLMQFSFPLSFAFLFITNLPSRPYYWVGNLPAVTWHNSTTILLMPFALWLFWESYNFLKNKDSKKLSVIFLLGLLTLFIKPNFIFVFIIVFPIFCYYRFGFSNITQKVLVILLLLGIIIVLQYLYIYHYVSSKNLSFGNEYNSIKLEVSPFEAWRNKSPNLFLSFIISLAYPLLFLLYNFKVVMRSLMYKYAISFFIIAMIFFIILVEKKTTGENIRAYNFIWQVIISVYILFLASIIEQIKIIINEGFSFKNKFLCTIFLFHFFSGILYVLRMMIYKDYH